MDSVLADLVIFAAGGFIGGALTTYLYMRMVSMVIQRILDKMISQGYFTLRGDIYHVRPQTGMPYDA